MLEKTEGEIKNGQSKETGNTQGTTRRQTKQQPIETVIRTRKWKWIGHTLVDIGRLHLPSSLFCL